MHFKPNQTRSWTALSSALWDAHPPPLNESIVAELAESRRQSDTLGRLRWPWPPVPLNRSSGASERFLHERSPSWGKPMLLPAGRALLRTALATNAAQSGWAGDGGPYGTVSLTHATASWSPLLLQLVDSIQANAPRLTPPLVLSMDREVDAVCESRGLPHFPWYKYSPSWRHTLNGGDLGGGTRDARHGTAVFGQLMRERAAIMLETARAG